jgi:hypothetical protein
MSAPKIVETNGQADVKKMKARLVSVTVALEVVADDGETLHPVETQPMRFSASEWPAFHVDLAMTQIQESMRPCD